jgi:hypothetical protein
MKDLVNRPVDPIPQSVVDQIQPAGQKVQVEVERSIDAVAYVNSNDADQLTNQINFDIVAQQTRITPSKDTAEEIGADKMISITDPNRLTRVVPVGGIVFDKAPKAGRPSLTQDTYKATVKYQGVEMVWGFSGFTTTIGDFRIITVITEYFTAGAAAGAGAGAGAATPPAITIEPEAPPLAAIPDDNVPLAPPVDSDTGSSDTTTIVPEKIPLANTSANWSLLSLLFVAVGLAFALISMAAAAGRREGKASSRVIFLRILSIAVAVVTLLTWILMDNFTSGYLSFVNSNTLVVGILFAATIVVSAISNVFEKKKEEVDPLAL